MKLHQIGETPMKWVLLTIRTWYRLCPKCQTPNVATARYRVVGLSGHRVVAGADPGFFVRGVQPSEKI